MNTLNLEKAEFSKIKYAIIDIDGILRAKYISKKKYLKGVQDGLGFCNVIFGWDSEDQLYPNTKYTGWHTAFPDAFATVDQTTARSIPWKNDNIIVLADFSNNKDFVPCPRTLLKRVNEKAQNLGYEIKGAQEFEWFNFVKENQSARQPITEGMFGYSLLRFSENKEYIHDLWNHLEQYRTPLEGLHTETGPGVYEGALEKASLVEAADRAALFKSAVKEIGIDHNITASFMAKWNQELPGCSAHFHQSLWDIDGKKNLFFDKNTSSNMSDTMQQYLAGQLYCLPYLMPFYAPTVNSYKRLIEGVWAPTTKSWGIENRTCALRVIPGSEQSFRIENRVPGADCNPHLAMAASVASGLYGIEHNLSLQDITKGNAYTQSNLNQLPRDLNEATNAMTSTPIAAELFGEEFINHFAQTRQWEWLQYRNQVSNWELNRYFEII